MALLGLGQLACAMNANRTINPTAFSRLSAYPGSFHALVQDNRSALTPAHTASLFAEVDNLNLQQLALTSGSAAAVVTLLVGGCGMLASSSQ